MTTAVNFNRVSLLERIKKAESNDELLALAIEGDGYEYASVNTQVKWKKASAARKAELRKGDKETEPKSKLRAEADRKGSKRGKTKK